MSIDLGLMNPLRVCDHFYKAFLPNINQYFIFLRGGGDITGQRPETPKLQECLMIETWKNVNVFITKHLNQQWIILAIFFGAFTSQNYI